MIKGKVTVTNPTGLHARPAALFVQTAGKFASRIWITHSDKKVNAKSIIGLMSLAVNQGADIIIEAEGQDEQIAVRELIELIVSGFKE